MYPHAGQVALAVRQMALRLKVIVAQSLKQRWPVACLNQRTGCPSSKFASLCCSECTESLAGFLTPMRAATRSGILCVVRLLGRVRRWQKRSFRSSYSQATGFGAGFGEQLSPELQCRVPGGACLAGFEPLTLP